MKNGTHTNDSAARRLIANEPPKSIAAEIELIGCILRDGRCIGEILETIDASDFYDHRHRLIFAAANILDAIGVQVDYVTIGDKLAEQGKLLEAGGGPYIVHLLEGTATAANFAHHAKIVKRTSLLRTLINIGTDTIRDAMDPSSDPETILADAEARFSQLSVQSKSIATPMLGEVLASVLRNIANRKANGSHDGVGSGFVDLDQSIGPVGKGTLTLIAARPSIGKTSLAMQVAEHASLDGKYVVFCSLEMSSDELGERMLAGHANVNSKSLKRGIISVEDINSLVGSEQFLKHAPLRIIDCPGIKMSLLTSLLRRIAMRRPIDLIIIDYLQLIASDERQMNRQEEISGISRRLKNLARMMNCPMIALSQLSRQVESRDSGQPKLSDLRDSGALEQDADLVWMMWRKNDQGLVGLSVAKNRNGPTAQIELIFDKERTRFNNITPEWQTEPKDGQF